MNDIALYDIVNDLRLRVKALEKIVLEHDPGQKLPVSVLCKKFKVTSKTVYKYVNEGFIKNVGNKSQILILAKDAETFWARK